MIGNFSTVTEDVVLGNNVKVFHYVNLYGCEIGDDTKVGTFVEIQKNSRIGSKCKISSHSFICSGVTIGDNCFIGHGVMFINDNYPKSVNSKGMLELESDWVSRFKSTYVGNNVSIGSNATILGGIKIEDNAIIGAGSVVTKDIPSNTIFAGNPARLIRNI